MRYECSRLDVSNIGNSYMDDDTRTQQHFFYKQCDCSANDEHLNIQKCLLVRLNTPSW